MDLLKSQFNIKGHTKQKTENKKEFIISRTKSPEQDWRESTETTEMIQQDGLTWEEGRETESIFTETTSSTIMNESFINNGYFCLKGEKFQYLG